MSRISDKEKEVVNFYNWLYSHQIACKVKKCIICGKSDVLVRKIIQVGAPEGYAKKYITVTKV